MNDNPRDNGVDAADIKMVLRGAFSERDGVFYCMEVFPDVDPSRHQDPADPKSWSYWRKENYSFFEKELGALSSGSMVVDLGAGELQFRNILSRFRLIAVDFYPYQGIRVVCDLNQPLPFSDASADAVVLSNTLEHVAEPNTLLSECGRILKPGGVLLGAVPFMIDIHQRPYDFYRYTDVNVDYLLKKHGFEKREVQPVLSFSPLLFLVVSRCFARLIQKTRYSNYRVIQGVSVFCMRVMWKIVRVMFLICDSLLHRCGGDEDLPLGYHFKGIK